MEHTQIIDIALFIGLFLLVTAVLQKFSNKTSFPYTVTLLLAGFFAHFLNVLFGLNFHLEVSPDFIYFLLLPSLLFEAAIHLNIHQFRLQFKTISFLATFGLLLSIFSVGVGLFLLLKVPLSIALLFGAIISATDPIAVLSLFKNLGAPKRLALIADGESMFNDATAVIIFRLISTLIFAGGAIGSQTFITSIGSFLYVFLGSIVMGAGVGYIFSIVVQKLFKERVLITAMTTTLAIGSFAAAEHFFHLSGVITTVIAGVIFGNTARAKMTRSNAKYLQEFWEYIGFLALSVVFFFATFSLDIALFTTEIPQLLQVVLIVLIARAISVYVTIFLSNRLPGFRNEPDIPLSWQHVLNWGGIRGVIPLVLVYSLPNEFLYKDEMLRFTLATLLFTLFVNGLTIKPLLIKLGLHIPDKEEEIIDDEKKLFRLHESREKLHTLSNREFNREIVREVDRELAKKQLSLRTHLLELSTPDEFFKSLRLQALEVERETLRKLYDQGRFSETVFFEFESELDVQLDALQYPSIYPSRVIEREGFMPEKVSYRKQLLRLRNIVTRYPTFSKLFGITEDSIISERYSLLRARIFTSYAALSYLERVQELVKRRELYTAIEKVRKMQDIFIQRNLRELAETEEKYPAVVTAYQRSIIYTLINGNKQRI